jgi:hypothetical protein
MKSLSFAENVFGNDNFAAFEADDMALLFITNAFTSSKISRWALNTISQG